LRGELLQTLNIRAHVFHRDATATSGAANLGQIDAQIARQLANHGRSRNGGVRFLDRFGSFRRNLFLGFGFRFRRGRSGFGRGLRCCGSFFGSRSGASAVQRHEPCSDADFIAGFDVNFGDGAGRSRRNRCDGLFVFKLKNRLVFGNLIAFFDEHIDHRSRVGTFAEAWKFYVHIN